MLKKYLFYISTFFSLFAYSFQSTLSEKQCERFYKEYQSIAVEMNYSSGEALQSLGNRYGRLQERLDSFCQHTQFKTNTRLEAESKTVEDKPERKIIFSNASKQSEWESFYTPPDYCLTETVDAVNKVRCKNEFDRFKDIFDQQWLQNNPEFAVQNTEKNTIISSPEEVDKPTTPLNESQVKPTNNVIEKPKPIEPINYTDQQMTGMDTFFYYASDYIYIVILIVLIPIAIRFGSPLIKRLATKHFSYMVVDKLLKKNISHSSFKFFNRVSVPVSSGMVEIDELVISPLGIFVITCQPQTGRVYADTTSEVWTEQTGKERSNFPSPTKLLPSKISGIKQLFGIETEIIGLIVFDESVDIRTNIPENVLKTHQLTSKIESYEEIVFSEEQISHFELLLSEYIPHSPVEEFFNKLKKKNKIDVKSEQVKE